MIVKSQAAATPACRKATAIMYFPNDHAVIIPTVYAISAIQKIIKTLPASLESHLRQDLSTMAPEAWRDSVAHPMP